MVGFGFMDNIIMIQAGDYIDSTLGVALGITTLTAAAMGNVCSDSSGVLFGGIVDAAVERLNLSTANLTDAQCRMRSTRVVATLGSLVGVVCGCLLGASTLLLMDLDASERLKRAQQLETMFEPVMKNGGRMVAAERCTLFLFDDNKQELWTKVAKYSTGEDDGKAKIIRLQINDNALACHAARTGELLNIQDAKLDARHDPRWDDRTGFATKQVLCYPIFEDGKLYGCLQAVNKLSGEAFTEDDEKLFRMLSSHISIFVEAVAG